MTKRLTTYLADGIYDILEEWASQGTPFSQQLISIPFGASSQRTSKGNETTAPAIG
jgi:hypothetical protein